MAETALTFLLEKVTRMVISYVDLVAGAEAEFEKLKGELEKMKAFLRVAAKKANKDDIFKEKERQVREAVYEVEDAIDDCLTQATIAAEKAKKNRLRKLAPGSYSMAKHIKNLRIDKVKPVVQLIDDYSNHPTSEGSGTGVEESETNLKTDQPIRRDKVVGLKDEEEKITNYLLDYERQQLDIISVIGMPGLGKTTLTCKIYESPTIQFAYRVRIWINVSQKFNRRAVLLEILKKFTSEDMSTFSDHDLDEKVRACLKSGKFLIVFDDVWSVDAWDSIEKMLPMENMEGKVVITSREEAVGKRASAIRGPHQQRFLDENESWELLQLEVFRALNLCPKELSNTGQIIAKNCNGLPLTIVVIGGILGSQYSRERPIGRIKNEWDTVSDNVIQFLKAKSIDRITAVVQLSYNRLPEDLRECFVYLGVFPEDYEISAWRLTHLWIAEGFIRPKEGWSLEETAQENLTDLINRNLLMVGKTNVIGEVKTCKVHDVIRSYCTSKSAEFNLFQEVKTSHDGALQPPVSETQKFHRLCFHSDLSKFLSGKPKARGVRSFLCFYKEPLNVEPKHISAIPDAFDSLRVLDSSSIKFPQFPPKITNLIHLRYLTLCVDILNILPEAISRLWNLQTLVVDTNSRTLKLKVNIWRMILLRHVKTKAAIDLDNAWEGKDGENLQTLSTISSESCTKNVHERARNLKKLGIRGKLVTVFRTNFLEELKRVEKLKLVNEMYESETEDQLERLPQSKCFPRNLKRLTLSKTSLKWDQMSALAEIKTLEVLKLKDNAFVGMSWTTVGDGFPNLQFLLIAETDLYLWEVSTNHFPRLECLTLKNCEQLKTIPEEVATNLRKLSIDRVSVSAKESAQNIKKQKEEDQAQQPKGPWVGDFQLSVGVIIN